MTKLVCVVISFFVINKAIIAKIKQFMWWKYFDRIPYSPVL
jgi:hypothetical protein